MDEAGIGPGKGRTVQARCVRGKRFDRKAQAVFLEQLAASCNVKQAAAAAGVHRGTVYKLRMNDAVFREGWARAIEQGYARLELVLLEMAMRGAEPIALNGDGEAPEGQAWDRDLALHLLREHKRGGAIGRGKGGAPLRRASMAEVRAHFVKKLKALGVRLDAAADEGEAE